jgi:predicted Zn-dependent protease with MMP-like domain
MTDWASLQAPSLAEFEELAAEAFRRLPARFRRLCEGVVVRVEDFPDDETLR